MPLVGTPHGRALAAQAVEVIAEDRGARLFAPVTSRGEAVGVLELELEDFPVEQTVADVALAAHFFAYVVIANRRYTDLFEWGQRSVPLSLAAEIQHRLLPGAFTCEAGQFTLAAWLQPAGEIGGDTFDFSLERDTLHLSMTDAMGHTMDAALLATVLVGALRNARRRGVELAEQARLANDALAEQAGESQFVTGLLVRIDLRCSHGRHRQRRPSPAAPAAGRAGRAGALGGRPPVRPAGRRRLPGASAAIGGGRPADVRHRRHAGARRCGPEHRRHPDRRASTCIRARRCSTSPRRSSRQAAASYATTPRRCASTGTAALPATATPPREQTARGGPIPMPAPSVRCSRHLRRRKRGFDPGGASAWRWRLAAGEPAAALGVGRGVVELVVVVEG